MVWFTNLKTGAKLLVAFGMIIVPLVLVAVVASNAITTVHDSGQNVAKKFGAVVDLVELKADQNRTRVLMLELVFTANRTAMEKIVQAIEIQTKEADQVMQEVEDLVRTDAPGSLATLRELQNLIATYRQDRAVQITLIFEGKVEEARQIGAGIQEQRYEKIRALEIQLGEEISGQARAQIAASGELITRSILLFAIAVGLALFVGVALTVALNRLISRPIEELTSVAERIAVGDLSVDVQVDARSHQVGVLAGAFERMTRSLRTMAGAAEQIAAGDLSSTITPQSSKDALGNAFARMVENLREQTRQLVEGANVLGAAANEIVSSSAQLASSATESAAAVSETTTTVEEVRQTAQVANQKAKAVADSAQKAEQLSQSGRKSTADVGTGMSQIRQQMEATATSMMRLSQQSQAIGQIIATVEDLAAQSNLLAVNAAIEAAKAGEHGKGFGVVAQEVKNLAEQSRQATNQVRTILSDIQKATTTAVMATEQGSRAVEAGEKQTGAAEEAIQALARSVTEAAHAATQIAASTQEQFVGMGQVAAAMESLQQASTQNVASAQQLETAARNLNGLGSRLTQMVKQYKV